MVPCGFSRAPFLPKEVGMASRPAPVPHPDEAAKQVALADLSGELLALLRPGGEVVDANSAWTELLDFEPGMGVDALRQRLHEDDRLAFEEARRTVLQGGDVHGQVVRFLAPDGRWLELEWSCRLLADHGLLAIRGRDVTEQRQLAREHDRRARHLEQVNDELREFAYVASHDLSEPLRMVTSYLDLVRRRYDEQLDDTGREFIHFAVDGAHRMRALIDDLLRYSRIGGALPDHAPVDLDALLRTVCQDLEETIGEAGATIEAAPLGTVVGDATMLGQLLQNLLVNAVKFRTAERAPHVTLGARRTGGTLVLEVSDNGIGIDATQLERIFQVFTRLHSRDEYDGTGIGLSICRRICERHGGTITARSVPGEGTTFVVTLRDEAVGA
ncbi:two-component sensor histidine kinase [Paraconexibacter algicola]|uniref:histidine kinase n=2 Tax=Paraconexibacter algicola TaxID=2133960 RepID=A0A2T4UMX0_9ACTN|nr:two-component sensor histidine kinase [Paraconexibacter algicola]